MLEDQKLNFLKMVMWHMQLKGLISRPGYTKIFTVGYNCDLGVGSKVQVPLDLFESVEIYDGAPSKMF